MGDALGAPWEFGPSLDDSVMLEMCGGGVFGWGVGQFTDDTEMAIPIARVIARGEDLCDPETLDNLVLTWCEWLLNAKDVGVQTRAILSSLKSPSEASARQAAKQFHEAHNGRSGGNGSLMRTAPIAIAYPEDIEGLIGATTRIAQLTHWEQDAYEAAILWNLAIRTSYIRNKLEVRGQLAHLPKASRVKWEQRIDEAEANFPVHFHKTNGWVVSAFQAAWSAIHHTDNFEDAVLMAVRAGGDTDTVGCITGGLAGAFYGYSAIPDRWRHPINGFDGVTSRGLVELALQSPAARWAGIMSGEWPTQNIELAPKIRVLVEHPLDPGLKLGNLAAIDMEEVEEVIALCRIGREQSSRPVHEFWLVDQPQANAHLAFTVFDCVRTIRQLREQGRSVLLLCHGAYSRTPFVAAAYSMATYGETAEQAIRGICKTLPSAQIQPEFLKFLQELTVTEQNL